MESLITYEPIQPKRRLGAKSDGGYVIVDEHEYDVYISCGVCNEFSFDEAFINYKTDIPAFAFDGTVTRPAGFPEKIQFHKINIAPRNILNYMTDLSQELDMRNAAFVKMDIEGHEWKWILATNVLPAIKQLVIEFHGLFDDSYHATHSEKLEALNKLSETHWLVHVHGNNYGSNGPQTPHVLECTYIRKDINVAGPNTTPLPLPDIDYPNNPNREDYPLNFWPFCCDKNLVDNIKN